MFGTTPFHAKPEPLPMGSMRTLHFNRTGPMIRHYNSDGRRTLRIQDLNPEIDFSWELSRAEMRRFAWRCVIAALFE